ncbi:MAG: AMP-binding protein [Chloroflexi bacterium]|nr:AMP-binding protein [Chloroflexota bacterium]
MTDRYTEIYAQFRWQVPREFNIAWHCCGRWANDPTRIALYHEDEHGATSQLTYAELQHQANRLSNILAGLGVRRGDRIAILAPQRPEVPVAHIAIYQMGAVAMPLSVQFGPDALEYRFQNSECVVAIVDAAALPAVLQIWPDCPTLRQLIVLGEVAGVNEARVLGWGTLLTQAASEYVLVATLADDAAVLIYTSGTTGPPKGALIPHRALIGNLPGFVYSQNHFPQTGDVFWTPSDWAWTGGLMDALLPTLYFGQPILGYYGRFDAEKAFYLLERYAVTNTFLVPTALKMMMKALPHPRQHYQLKLRAIMSAGEAVGDTVFAWVQAELGVTLNEMFGQTEVNYIVGNSYTEWPAKPGCIGRPYPGHRVGIIDDEGQVLVHGELGEIAVWDEGQDPVFFLGYWRNDEATRQKYSGNWCRTGDLGRMDADGYIWYQGRADDMIKSAAYRIGPSEIESCLVKHPAVANAAVIGKPDELRGTIIKAFIVLTPNSPPSEALRADLQQFVRARLAPYQYPREIEFIDALPMTTTGKVQRRLLRAR